MEEAKRAAEILERLEMLGKGEAPPKEFSRPEVAQILINYYQSLN